MRIIVSHYHVQLLSHHNVSVILFIYVFNAVSRDGLVILHERFRGAILQQHHRCTNLYRSVSAPCRVWCPAAITTTITIIRPARTRTCSITRRRTRCTTIRCPRRRASRASRHPRTRSTRTRTRRPTPLPRTTRPTRLPAPRAQVKRLIQNT